MFWFDIPAGLADLVAPWSALLNLVLIAALIALGVATWRRPALGVSGVALALPLYLARAHLGGLPTTFLELSILVVAAITGLKARATKSLRRDPLRWPALALVAAGTLALAWSPDARAAAGLWRAYLVEPALLYAVARFALREERDYRRVVGALLASAIAVALLAVWQQATGIGIAEPHWVPLTVRRVTAHYTSPNAVGLYLGPIVALAAGLLVSGPRRGPTIAGTSAVLTIGLAAIAFTKSAGTWLGLLAAALTISWFTFGRVRTAGLAALVIAAAMLIPSARQRLATELTDPAAANRRALWRGSIAYLTATPKNFLLGAGIHGFGTVQDRFRDPRKMEPLLYPHTIALNFWMEYGLAGLLAAAWLGMTAVRAASRQLQNSLNGRRLGALAALATIAGHGLVDNPYFKNDLAALTWLLLALAVASTPEKNSAAAGQRSFLK